MDNNCIKVKKRNNSFENYSEKNIVNVLKSAGLAQDKAETIGHEVSSWLRSQNLQEVSSLQIRDKVIELLKPIDSEISDLYVWYESTKK